MRGLLAAIRQALAAMGGAVWRRCRLTGKMIMEMMTPAAPPAPPYEPESVPEVDVYDRVKAAAMAMLDGTKSDQVADIIADLDDGVISWMGQMDRVQLARIALASPEAIRAHMRGKQTMRGVPAADRESVAEYRRAREASRRDPMWQPADEPDQEYAGLAFI